MSVFRTFDQVWVRLFRTVDQGSARPRRPSAAGPATGTWRLHPLRLAGQRIAVAATGPGLVEKLVARRDLDVGQAYRSDRTKKLTSAMAARIGPQSSMRTKKKVCARPAGGAIEGWARESVVARFRRFPTP